MEARCDECGRIFTAAPQTRQEGEIETTFFACTHCGRECVVCRTDPGIRVLQAQVERQRRRNGERQRQGELTKRHTGHMRRKVNQLRAGLDALNRAE